MSAYKPELDPVSPPELPTKVSKVPKFMGVTHLAIGGLFVVSGLLGLLNGGSQIERLEAQLAALETGGVTLSQKALESLSALEGPSRIVNGLDLLAAVLMAVAGWGLLKYKSWGRTVSNVYAVFSLLVKAANCYVMSVLAMPFYEDLVDSVSALKEVGPHGLQNIMVSSVVVTALYPIATLVVVNMKGAMEDLK